MTTSQRWNRREYQRIAAVALEGNRLRVGFEDGSEALVEADRVLPPGVLDPDWRRLTFSPYEIVVPTSTGDAEVPWSTIRLLTDREYSAHLAESAEDQAQRIGLRIRQLRKSRKLTGKALAERAGIAPQSLSRIERGRHGVVLTTLQRILGAMGCSLRDLADQPGDVISAAS